MSLELFFCDNNSFNDTENAIITLSFTIGKTIINIEFVKKAHPYPLYNYNSLSLALN